MEPGRTTAGRRQGSPPMQGNHLRPPGHVPWKGRQERPAHPRCDDTQLQPRSDDRMSSASLGSLTVAAQPWVGSPRPGAFTGPRPGLGQPRTKNEVGARGRGSLEGSAVGVLRCCSGPPSPTSPWSCFRTVFLRFRVDVCLITVP